MSAGPAPTPGLGLALRLARREMRGGLRGFRLFLACLALGVAAIAAVGSVSQSMLRGLATDGRALLGGDLDLRLVHRPASPEQRAWLAARGTVSEVVEMRAMARAATPGGRRALVELRAVDGAFPLYGAVETDPRAPLQDLLARRDGAWGAVVDPRLSSRLGLNEGARVLIGNTTFEIRAALVREPDRATRIAAFGPRVLISPEALAATGLVLPGSLLHYHYRLRVAEGTDVAALRADLGVAFPDAGWRIRGPDEAAPGVTHFIERLGLYLTLVGLTALLIGGLGIANAVRAYLDRRTATIATLKCLGAPGRLIFQVYLAQVLALALGGVALGLALGAGAPFAVAKLLADALGWRVPVGLHALPLAVAAVFGVLTAVVFSLWPLARARAVPAASLFRDAVAPAAGPPLRSQARTLGAIVLAGGALAALAVATSSDPWPGFVFVLGALGALGAFRLVAAGLVALARRLPRPRRPAPRLALANLYRPGAPTGSVVVSLGLGLSVLVAIALVEANLARQLRDEVPANAPAIYFIDIQPNQAQGFDRLVAQTPGVGGLRRTPMLRGRIVAVNETPTERLAIPAEVAWVFRGDRGLTWAARAPADTEIVAGAWWPADYAGPPLVSLDAEVGRALGIGPGDSLTVNVLGREVRVRIANLRTIDWSRLTMNFIMVFSPGLLEAAPQTYIATVDADPAAADALERAVTERYVNVSAIRVSEALGAVRELFGRISLALVAAGAVALAAGVLVLAGAVAPNTAGGSTTRWCSRCWARGAP